MQIFAVISIEENSKLDAKVSASYEDAHIKIAPNVWFVADSGKTTKDICERLDVRPEGLSGVVVVRFESFFGLAPSFIWEWIAAKMGVT